jgi:GTPase SAR1 family protein
MRARGSTLYLKRESVTILEEPEDLQSYFDSLAFQIDQSLENSKCEFGKVIDTTNTPFHDSKAEQAVDARTMSISTACSRESTNSRVSDFCAWDELFDDVKPMKKFEVMIVGSRGAGKRSIISAMFPQISMESSEKQPFDYICRRVCQDKIDSIFKFWTLETKTDLALQDYILPIYYKKIQFFMFVYDCSNPNSLNELQPIIEAVMKAKGTDVPYTFLIGNIRKGEERKISYKEASEFKDKYDIAIFTECVISSDNLSMMVDVIEDSCKVITHC